MKKKIKYIFISISLIILLLLVFNFVYDTFNKKNMVNNFIIEKSYMNMAWGTNYYGCAIFDDGSIYIWKTNDNSFYKYNETTKDKKNWIIKNGVLQKKKISKRDLEKLKIYIGNLKDNIKTKYTANDAGSEYIQV